MSTKYYDNKNDGYLFANAPKDVPPEELEGTVTRDWTRADGTSGTTLGYRKQSVTGMVRTAFVKDFGDRLVFNIGLQDGEEDQEVVGTRLFGADTFAFVQALGNIDLSKPLTIGVQLNPKKAWTNRAGKRIVPSEMSFSQDGKKINWVFAWDKDTRTFKGLPMGRKVEKLGVTKMDHAERDAVYEDEIMKFIKRVSAWNADHGIGEYGEKLEEKTEAGAEEVAEGSF